MLKNIKKHYPSTINHHTLYIPPRRAGFHFPLIIMFALILLIGCGNENEKDMTTEEQVYYCPMHPEVTSTKPGVCPICHMDLVIKGSDYVMEDLPDGVVSMSDNKLILANVSTVKVIKENLNKTIFAYSYLDFAEQNRKLITARVNGRIEKLFVDKTGDYIRKGERLFEIYSPDLVQAQNDYLIALNNNQNIKLISNEGTGRDKNHILNSVKKKLLLFGITEDQIAELERTEEVKLTLTYHSPMNGTIIEKKALEGMYVNEGSIIYDIADLSTLWNISEVYADDLGLIKEGSRVELTLQSYPGEIFEGKVNLIYPVVNSQTRTVKIRSIVQNKGNKLKPNMYGETKFEINLGESLVIPEGAILFTGERKLVYVKVDEGKFSVREIETGYKSGNKYQVISGLTEEEEVASSGGYLIDSESQLRGGNAPVHQHDGEESMKEMEDLSRPRDGK